jgi:hypothetical protein
MISALKSLSALKVFRAFSCIIALDILAVIILAGLNPIELLNPFRFLESIEDDLQLSQTLYFPKVTQAFTGEKESVELYPIPLKLMFLADQENQRAPVVAQARAIVSALARGGNSLKVQRLFTDPALVSTYWYYKKTLILGIEPIRWNQVAKRKKKSIVKSLEKTLLENIPGITEVSIYLLP